MNITLAEAIMIWFPLYTDEIRSLVYKMLLPKWKDSQSQHPVMYKLQEIPDNHIERKRALPIVEVTELMRQWITELCVEQILETDHFELMKKWRNDIIENSDGDVVELNGRLEFLDLAREEERESFI